VVLREGCRGVVPLIRLKAAVQLAEELVEQVTLSADTPVAGASSALVIAPTREIVSRRRAHPHEASCGDSVVLCAAVTNIVAFAGGSGDWCGAGICVECPSIGEALGIVATFRQQAPPEPRIACGFLRVICPTTHRSTSIFVIL
jgi:hypothetical protein